MSNELDFRFYASVARRRIGFFIIPLLLVVAAGSAIVLSLPKIYNSSAKILVESQQIPDAFVKSTVTTLAAERLQVIQQRVMTRENLLRLVDKFELFKNRKNLSRADIADLMHERVTFAMLDIGLAGKKPNRRDERLTVAFALGFDYEDPLTAAKVANELVTIVLEEDVRNRTGNATETTKFLNRESERLGVELEAMEAAIAEFKLKNSDTLPEKLSFNMSLLEQRQFEINQTERAIAEAESQKRLLELEANVKRAAGPLGQPARGGLNPLEQRLADLRSAYAQKSVQFSDNHPDMRALRKVIAALEQQTKQAGVQAASQPPLSVDDPSLGADLRLIAEKISLAEGSIERSKKRLSELALSVENLQKVVLGSSGIGAALQSMERRRAALQSTADDITIKLGQARLGERMEEDQQAERFAVLEAPIVPQEPDRPKRAQLLLMVLGGAVGMGGASAFGAEFLDNTIRRSRDITHKLNLQLLVTIPYISTRSEVRRRAGKLVLKIAIALLLIGLALAAIHQFYRPLDLLWLNVMQKLNL